MPPLGADMTASLARPAGGEPSQRVRMTSFVQNSFLNGPEAPRECQRTNRATQDDSLGGDGLVVGSGLFDIKKVTLEVNRG